MRLSLPLSILLIFSISSGCLLDFKKNYCDILDYKIIDNNGRLGVKLIFDSTGNMTFISLDPLGKEMDRSFVPEKFGEIILNLSYYHKNPTEETYKIFIYDISGKRVDEIDIPIKVSTLEIESINLTWWKEERSSYSIVEVKILAMNLGEIPVYLDRAHIEIENRSLEAKTLENVLRPGYVNITLSVYIDSLKYENYSASITLLDLDNNPLAKKSFLVSPYFNPRQDRSSKSWRFKDKTYSLTLPLPQYLYNYCSSLPRPDLEDYSFYAIDPKSEGFVDMLAKKLSSMYEGDDLIDFIASFAQSIDYRNESGEYPKYPIELLHDGYGDCEDKAILTSSILYRLGYDVCLIRFEDHMAVGVHIDKDYKGKVFYTDENGKEYIYLETSNIGWKLGEADEDYKQASNYTIYHVTAKPILIQICKPPVRHQIENQDYIDLRSTIINIGNKDAIDVKLRVKVEIHGSLITVTESDVMLLREGEGKDVYLKFNTPNLSFSKMFIIVVYNGKELNRSSFIFL